MADQRRYTGNEVDPAAPSQGRQALRIGPQNACEGSWKPRKLEEDAQEYSSRGCEMYRKTSLTQGEGERGGTGTWGRAE